MKVGGIEVSTISDSKILDMSVDFFNKYPQSTGSSSGGTKVIVCVVWGAPGTGKTTLLKNLESADDIAGFRICTVAEPTDDAKIKKLIKEAYCGDKAAEVAAYVQNMIMEARHASYVYFVENRLEKERQAASAENKDLLVVCDGHIITDELVYVRSKHASEQISDSQLLKYWQRRRELERVGPSIFAKPTCFVQLRIDDDDDGQKHWHRVCVERNTGVESDVPPSVFAHLAAFADSGQETLAELAESIQINTDEIDAECLANMYVLLMNQQSRQEHQLIASNSQVDGHSSRPCVSVEQLEQVAPVAV